MSYLVLARKLRPQKFCDLLGQEIIAQTLRNAIQQDRLAHAFLFSGPRGVGKTSCARILSKAINCLNPQQSEPCNECKNCQEISEGIATDVVEIDAASNRGIEHIRELRGKIHFAPARCRYKVYIIDETHMLTVESFNALLKTLEEPPGNVIFILATTDPHKVLPTVLSRCQRHDFSAIDVPAMIQYLDEVIKTENVKISIRALNIIAQKSAGGMRDALTALDTLISCCGNEIPDERLYDILGFYDPLKILELIEHIAQKEIAQTIAFFRDSLEIGMSLSVLLRELLVMVKDLSLLKSLGTNDNYWRSFPPIHLQALQTTAKVCSDSELRQYFQILLEVEQQIKRSLHAEICMEMGLLRLCETERLVGLHELLGRMRQLSQKNHPVFLQNSPKNSLSSGYTTPEQSALEVKEPFPHPSKINSKFHEYSLPPSSREEPDFPVYSQNNGEEALRSNKPELQQKLETPTMPLSKEGEAKPEFQYNSEKTAIDSPQNLQEGVTTIKPLSLDAVHIPLHAKNGNEDVLLPNNPEIYSEIKPEHEIANNELHKPRLEKSLGAEGNVGEHLPVSSYTEENVGEHLPVSSYTEENHLSLHAKNNNNDEVPLPHEPELQNNSGTIPIHPPQNLQQKATLTKPLSLDALRENWGLFLEKFNAENHFPKLYSFLHNIHLIALKDKDIEITAKNSSLLQLISENEIHLINEALNNYFNSPLKLKLQFNQDPVGENQKELEDRLFAEKRKKRQDEALIDPAVQKSLQHFEGSQVEKIYLDSEGSIDFLKSEKI